MLPYFFEGDLIHVGAQYFIHLREHGLNLMRQWIAIDCTLKVDGAYFAYVNHIHLFLPGYNMLLGEFQQLLVLIAVFGLRDFEGEKHIAIFVASEHCDYLLQIHAIDEGVEFCIHLPTVPCQSVVDLHFLSTIQLLVLGVIQSFANVAELLT